MYPVNDIDAQLVLAILLAAKRRPAHLADLVAAAEVLGFPITAPRPWAETLNRALQRGVVQAVAEGYVLSAHALTFCSTLPKKAETDERVFLIREELKNFPAVDANTDLAPLEEAALRSAVRAHAESKAQGGKNLLMPKPAAPARTASKRGAARPTTRGQKRRT